MISELILYYFKLYNISINFSESLLKVYNKIRLFCISYLNCRITKIESIAINRKFTTSRKPVKDQLHINIYNLYIYMQSSQDLLNIAQIPRDILHLTVCLYIQLNFIVTRPWRLNLFTRQQPS